MARCHGSSPLTRGAPVVLSPSRNFRGLIPAHAGSTFGLTCNARQEGAHPRSRGEHMQQMLYTIPLTGSSPLTRGARGAIGLPQPLQGLIPAHAGSTGGTNPKPTHPWAHPRSRGEHFPAGIGAGFGPGSSPLTRGARFLSRLGRGCVRLIPAHAGSTTASPLIFILPPAHPRSRGEHYTNEYRGQEAKGSSPLTRGAPDGCAACADAAGLIPAHAGSTGRVISPCAARSAHPRSRGEHTC